VTLAEKLIGKGYDLRVFDPLVRLDRLVGANKTYILREIPHISRLMADSLESVLEASEIVVLGNTSPEFLKIQGHPFLKKGTVLDLVGLLKGKEPAGADYQGICW
jgi:GDP-mannose 6-dehydrogenase